MIFLRTWPAIEREEIPYVGVYTLIHLTTSVAHYSGYAILPLTSVTCVSYTAQILVGIIIFRLFGTKDVTIIKLLAALLCVTGIVLVMQPMLIFGRRCEPNCHQLLDSTNIISMDNDTGDLQSFNSVYNNARPIRNKMYNATYNVSIVNDTSISVFGSLALKANEPI